MCMLQKVKRHLDEPYLMRATMQLLLQCFAGNRFKVKLVRRLIASGKNRCCVWLSIDDAVWVDFIGRQFDLISTTHARTLSNWWRNTRISLLLRKCWQRPLRCAKFSNRKITYLLKETVIFHDWFELAPTVPRSKRCKLSYSSGAHLSSSTFDSFLDRNRQY